MKKVIKYVLAVCFILGGIGVIFKGSLISGLLLTSLGTILIPQVSEQLNSKVKTWSNKPMRYGIYIGLFLLSALTRGDLREASLGNNANSYSSSEYREYAKKVKTNIKDLSEKNKESRKNMIEKLKATETYKVLVDSSVVSVEYLPLLTTINGGIRHSYINNNGKEVFGMDESIKSSVNGKDKLNFAICVISLSMPQKGGFPEELIQVFNSYRKKYKLYGVPSQSYSNSGEKSEAISNSYNMSAIFGLLQPTNENVLDAIYEANNKGISNWVRNSNTKYINEFTATKKGYTAYVKKVYPDSPYVLNVDIEITATDLYNAYEANEVSADENYKGKKIAVTGTINSIGKDILNNPYVSLNVSYLQGVNCYFGDENNKIISKLSKGQRVTIIGICEGLTLTDVVIQDCSLW